jgi:NAD(P)-dependent dehydrogenase (short-subunit alcohol dehydrogenase family)
MSYSRRQLEGKIAVITGGNSGIGLATAKRFVAEGANVFITGRRQRELDDVVNMIGGSIKGIRSDVSNLHDLDHIFSVIKKDVGRIDVIFANAGGGEFAPLGEITEARFDNIS